MKNGGTDQQQVGSAIIIDSDISNCGTFVDMAWTPNAKPIGAGQLILENIALNNVPPERALPPGFPSRPSSQNAPNPFVAVAGTKRSTPTLRPATRSTTAKQRELAHRHNSASIPHTLSQQHRHRLCSPYRFPRSPEHDTRHHHLYDSRSIRNGFWVVLSSWFYFYKLRFVRGLYDLKRGNG